MTDLLAKCIKIAVTEPTAKNLKKASVATTWDAYEQFRVFKIIVFHSGLKDYLLADCWFS